MVSQLLLTNDDTLINEGMDYFTKTIKTILKKEQRKKQNKKHYQKHTDYFKEYYKDNKDERLFYQSQYKETPNGKKSYKISTWKQQGIICDDFNVIYDKYMNTTNCDNCNCILTTDRYNTYTTKCMDHDHKTGLFRNILCFVCNVKRK